MKTLFPFIVSIYLLMSIATFIVYGWDKKRAIRQSRRFSEHTLHMMELLGGWPGAFFGQRYFHHKWKKGSYMFTFWCIVAVHLLVWTMWFAR